MKTSELERLALRGSVWIAAGYAGEQLLRLAGNLIVTRLLFPEAYGWMAIVWAVVTGLELLSEIGIRESIVQGGHADDAGFLDALWTLQLARGGLLFAAACALAPALARFYGAPELARLIPCAGSTLLFGGLGSTRLLAQGRELRVARIAALDFAAQAVTVGVMILWAWLHPTVWALAGAPVIGSLARLAGSHALSGGFVQRLRPSREALARTLQIGRFLVFSTALGFVASQSDRLILGRLISPELLGVYSVAFFLSEGVAQLAVRIGQRVLHPTFRKAAGAGALAGVYRRTRRQLALALLPIAGAVLVHGDLVVGLLYDARYQAAGWMLEMLALRIATSALLPPAAAVLLALGDARTELGAAAARALWLVAALPTGFFWAGLEGAVTAVAAADLVRLPILWRGLARHGLLDLRAELSDLVWLAAGAGLAWLAFS
jgi:O-antigen/teichoic acid export membrane protein